MADDANQVAAGSEENVAGEEGREEEPRGRGRRGRGGRSRRKSRRDEEAPATASDEVTGETAATPEEDDDTEEIDSLSDWSVPSWTELIASLYRPER
jgi:hypothetical protein